MECNEIVNIFADDGDIGETRGPIVVGKALARCLAWKAFKTFARHEVG